MEAPAPAPAPQQNNATGCFVVAMHDLVLSWVRFRVRVVRVRVVRVRVQVRVRVSGLGYVSL